MVRLLLCGVSFPLSRLRGVQSNNSVQRLRLIRGGKEILAVLRPQKECSRTDLFYMSRPLKRNPSGVLSSIPFQSSSRAILK